MVPLKNYQKVKSLIFSIIQGIAASYLGINFSYNFLYTSCKKHDIPFKWIIYQFLMIAWCVYISLGFPSSGSVGIATLLDIIATTSKPFYIFTALINTILCCATAIFAFFTLSAAQKYQKVSGQEDQLLNSEN
jgi:hypothetical protein